MRNRFALLFAFIVTCAPVLAQQPSYSGTVQTTSTSTDNYGATTRLRRPLFGSVSHQDMMPAKTQTGVAPSLGQGDSSLLRNTFGAGTGKTGLSGAVDMADSLLKPLSGATYDNRVLNPPVLNAAVNKDDAPYVWVQSIAGGYIDQTGHCKEVVRGDHLRDWGGKFVDGTAVPKGPVQINAAGHVYRGGTTNTEHFQDKGYKLPGMAIGGGGVAGGGAGGINLPSKIGGIKIPSGASGLLNRLLSN